MPLATVQWGCHDLHTFSFRLPLMQIHRAWNWDNIPGCASLIELLLGLAKLAGRSMNSVEYSARFLGTILKHIGRLGITAHIRQSPVGTIHPSLWNRSVEANTTKIQKYL